MSGVIVIGAGIAGCTVARMLAEREQHVQVYEQSSGVGGVLKTFQNVTIATTDRVACSWLLSHVLLQTYDDGHLSPRRGGVWMCEQLVAHPRISLMKHTTIVDVLLAKQHASAVVSTASPDALVGMRYGPLPWQNGKPMRHPMSMAAYWQHCQLLSNAGILWCGSLASFEVLSIPQIIRQCMHVTDTITQQIMRPVAPL